MKVKHFLKMFFLSLLVIFVIGYCLPQHFVKAGTQIGTVGNTGNAAVSPHTSIIPSHP